MSRFHVSKFRPKTEKMMNSKLWKAEMQKQFCWEPLREKEYTIKKTRAESIDSNFKEYYICFGLYVAQESPKVVALDTKEEDDGDSPNNPDSAHLIGALPIMKSSAPMPLFDVCAVGNGWEIDAMVDKGTIYNIVSKVAAARLKLNGCKHTSRMKAINSKVKSVASVVYGASIGLGS